VKCMNKFLKLLFRALLIVTILGAFCALSVIIYLDVTSPENRQFSN
jgi:hypothetical protein